MAYRRPFIVLVGLPGTGKSTFVRKFLCDNRHMGNIHTISTDNFIEYRAYERKKTYNEIFHDEIKDAERFVKDYLKKSLALKCTIICDQTHLTLPSRRRKLAQVNPKFYEKICIVFLPPQDRKEYQKILDGRPWKTIPKGRINEMMRTFVMPEYSEGFDKMFIHSSDGSMTKLVRTDNADLYIAGFTFNL